MLHVLVMEFVLFLFFLIGLLFCFLSLLVALEWFFYLGRMNSQVYSRVEKAKWSLKKTHGLMVLFVYR